MQVFVKWYFKSTAWVSSNDDYYGQRHFLGRRKWLNSSSVAHRPRNTTANPDTQLTRHTLLSLDQLSAFCVFPQHKFVIAWQIRNSYQRSFTDLHHDYNDLFQLSTVCAVPLYMGYSTTTGLTFSPKWIIIQMLKKTQDWAYKCKMRYVMEKRWVTH
jgi:hypothetical protein